VRGFRRCFAKAIEEMGDLSGGNVPKRPCGKFDEVSIEEAGIVPDSSRFIALLSIRKEEGQGIGKANAWKLLFAKCLFRKDAFRFSSGFRKRDNRIASNGSTLPASH
jgi:hypothetical protein